MIWVTRFLSINRATTAATVFFPLGGFGAKSESKSAGYGKVEAPRWLLYRTRCWYHNQTSQLYTCESMLVQLIRRWFTRHSNFGITDLDINRVRIFQ